MVQARAGRLGEHDVVRIPLAMQEYHSRDFRALADDVLR